MSCKNCQGCCIHNMHKELYHKVEHKNDKGEVWMVENVFDGYEHYCDKNPEGYKKWHEDHKHDTYDQYKTSIMECYEPTESTRLLNEALDTSRSILEKLNKTE